VGEGDEPGHAHWSHDGIICTGESYKSVVKLTFAKGASLKDPAGLFNSSLDGNTRRAIDIHEGEEVDASAFKALIRAAVALNTSAERQSRGERSRLRESMRRDVKLTKASPASRPSSQAATHRSRRPTATPRAGLHRGHAGLEARRRAPSDALIARNVPKVRKAVKWNSPFYGIEGQGWFLRSTSSPAT
jgi:hypothetical protein